MLDFLDPSNLFYAALAGLILVLADAAYLLANRKQDGRARINHRLRHLDDAPGREQASIDLKRERGMDASGQLLLKFAWINRLIVQSGLPWGIRKLQIAAGIAGIVCAAAAAPWQTSFQMPLAGLFGAVVLPVATLLFLRRRRRRKFTEQFAEAIEMIVRSLRAGHPVPSAIRMVARNMPDPIGSEFGMVEDEVTFGLNLEAAMRNLQERVGQEDLPLFVTSVAIQTSTGGNLTELLENLGSVIRQRVKMRRKIHALSAEGRFSAIILSSMPVVVFLVLNLLSPRYFGDHWGDPLLTKGLAGSVAWAFIGNLVMWKMINFKN